MPVEDFIENLKKVKQFKISENIKIDELSSALGTFKGLQIHIGKIVDEEWEEPMGPTPFPQVGTLRNWDRTLLERYKPFYMPFCDLFCLCTYGKCDLTGDKTGACGLTQAGQQSRIVMIACCIGASTHAAHGRHMLDHLLEEYGSDTPLDVALNTNVEAPHVRLVCGFKPTTIGDLEEALDYVETQLVQLVAAAHTGQEGDPIDFESKAFHAGMLDHVALEVADIMQSHCRKMDVVARYGGEEFIIMLVGTEEKDAYEVAEKIRSTFESRKFTFGEKTHTTSISMGVVEYSSEKTKEELVKKADTALYSAKRQGKNRVCMYRESEKNLA